MVNAINGKRISSKTAKFLDSRLQNEGYDSNFSLSAPSPRKPFKIRITPTLSYSQNINGGNPSKNLTLGNLTFVGDPSLVRKEGLLSGARLNLNGRFIYGEGRYLKYNLYAGYEYNVEHSLGVNTSGLSTCSVNHISNWWYFDVCGNANRTRKEITEQSGENLSFIFSKMLTGNSKNHHKVRVGINRQFSANYIQNQLVMGLDTIHSNNSNSEITLTVGESVQNQLATKLALSGKLRLHVYGKQVTFHAGYNKSNGGKILGFDRYDKTLNYSVSYPVTPYLFATIGYRKTNSSIDYYELEQPIFGLNFKSLKF